MVSLLDVVSHLNSSVIPPILHICKLLSLKECPLSFIGWRESWHEEVDLLFDDYLVSPIYRYVHSSGHIRDGHQHAGWFFRRPLCKLLVLVGHAKQSLGSVLPDFPAAMEVDVDRGYRHFPFLRGKQCWQITQIGFEGRQIFGRGGEGIMRISSPGQVGDPRWWVGGSNTSFGSHKILIGHLHPTISLRMENRNEANFGPGVWQKQFPHLRGELRTSIRDNINRYEGINKCLNQITSGRATKL